MKRFSLLIEASEVPGEDPLPGAVVDAKNYHTWLYSRPGGDWYGSEIVTLNTPRVAEVKRAIESAGKIDYAFIAFSGHGYHSQELDLTKICLRDGTMTVRELFPNADRCSVVVDACRNVMSEIFAESFQLSLEERALFAKAAQIRNYRKEFEDFVASAERGAAFLYSCDLNESAGESRVTGGYFSRFLVETGREFSDRHTTGRTCLPMNDAFAAASSATTARNRSQHPQMEAGRRRVHFPFAI